MVKLGAILIVGCAKAKEPASLSFAELVKDSVLLEKTITACDQLTKRNLFNSERCKIAVDVLEWRTLVKLYSGDVRRFFKEWEEAEEEMKRLEHENN